MNRRDLLKTAVRRRQPPVRGSWPSRTPNRDPDYVVVGSGAGGGTVAAGSPRRATRCSSSRRAAIRARRTPPTYDVPAFHPFATEDPAMRWDFFVRHYSDARTAGARSEVRSPSRTASGIRAPARSAAAPRTTR